MLKKKLLSFAIVTALVSGLCMSVSASDYTEHRDQATGNAVIDASGNVTYVNTTRHIVTLPTSAAVGRLIIDPQGLESMTTDEASLDDLAASAGKIKGEHELSIINHSSVPMKVTAKFTASGNAQQETSLSAVTATGNVQNSYIMYAVPSSVDTKNGTVDYVSSGKGIKMDGNLNNFVLDKAEYKVTRTGNAGSYSYDYKLTNGTGNAHSTAFSIEGKVNPKADWSAYTGNNPTKFITLHAEFSFAEAASTDTVASGNPYGMMSTANTLTVPVPTPPVVNAAPSIATRAFDHSGTTGSKVTVDLGSGSLAATGIDKVQWCNTINGTYTDYTENNQWSFNAATKEITLTTAAYPGAAPGDLRYAKVIFNDSAHTEVILTITKRA